MRPLQQMLPQVVDRKEVLRAARAQIVLRRWEEFVGPALAERSLPDRYEAGTAWVAVESSAWAHELRMRGEVILDRLNEAAGERLFEKIRFGVRPRKGLPATPFLPPKECTLTYEGMTFREIAERRLRLMREDAARTDQ